MAKAYRFRRERLEAGMWVHVRSNWWLGRGIRYALDKWEARVCARLGVPAARVWGNHDGLIMTPLVPHIGPDYGIGEALAQGEVISPLEDYERDMAKGELEVRIYKPLLRTPNEDVRRVMWQAAVNWETDVSSHRYDYWAYVGLIVRCFFGIDVKTSDRTKFWCTEGCQDSYDPSPMREPAYDILQDDTPTPMHVEQVAGLIPMPAGRRITLQDVTADVIEVV